MIMVIGLIDGNDDHCGVVDVMPLVSLNFPLYITFLEYVPFVYVI
jgi:hypothetical protein